MRDPRVVRSVSVLSLFEQQQERLAPVLMGMLPSPMTICPGGHLQRSGSAQAHGRSAGGGCVVAAHVTVHRRGGLADLAGGSGTDFYSQQRSGWLGRPFTVLSCAPCCNWPMLRRRDPGRRPAHHGHWRHPASGALDELPQLLNVLNGEMSLIGPCLSGRNWSINWSAAFPITASVTGCVRASRLGPGVPLCQQHRGFRSQALLRPLLPAALQHLAGSGDPNRTIATKGRRGRWPLSASSATSHGSDRIQSHPGNAFCTLIG